MLTASVVLYKTPREQTQSLLESVLSSCIERLFIIDNSPDDSRRILGDALWKEKKDARYCLMDSGYDTVINPPCLSGCFMFLRLSALTAHDIFFDDRFFMYFEDFDFIHRLHRVGKTLFFPGAQIVHAHAKESYRSRKMLLCHIKSAVRYFNKYGWLFDRERTEWNRRILGEIRAEVSRE